MYRRQPYGFKTRQLVSDFHIPISNALFPSRIDVTIAFLSNKDD